MKTALFIGRFQPAHRGHLQAMLDINKVGVEHIIIGIGSAQKERTEENPFTYVERKRILELFLGKQPFTYEIFPIPDVGDNEKRLHYINTTIPRFDIVLSGNPRIESIFKPKGYSMYIPEITVEIKGTNTRKAIALQDKFYIDQAINDDVYNYLLEIDAPKRLQGLMPNLYKYVIQYTTNIFQKDGSIRKLDDTLSYSIEPFDGVASISAHEQIIQHTKDSYSIDIQINNSQPQFIETHNKTTNSYSILLIFESSIK